jgi:serine/threonine-protein phosphatase 2A catalytic subunit
MNLKELLSYSIKLNLKLPFRHENMVERKRDRSLVIIGDLHGERDSFEEINYIVGDEKEALFVFLGDYVDRGPDCIGLLKSILTFQMENEDRVILLRGNHEDWNMNVRYSFASELISKGYENIIEDIIGWYESLPLIALLEDIVALHGGVPKPIPSSMKTLAKAKASDSVGLQILWNDPLDEQYWPRGGGTKPFTADDLTLFLKLTNSKLLIRGHQYVPNKGYKLNFDNRCVTIFSASYGYSWPRCFVYFPRSCELKLEDVEKHIICI